MMATGPNILVFNPDQWRGDVLGHMGNPAARTPNIDRIVEAEAVSFSNAFCQNPVCTPSRCSFMTGWYPHVRGHRTMHHMLRFQHGEPNLLRVLRDNGYFVWWGGKNDLVPRQLGFADDCDVKWEPSPEDFSRWGCTPRHNLHGSSAWRGEPGSDTYYSFYAGRLDKAEERVYCDEDWARVLAAVEMIEAYDGEKPLCVYLPLEYPHPPYGVEEPYFSAIDRNALPPRIAASKDRGEPSLLAGIRERQNLGGWTEERWSELRATYYGMCMRLDEQFSMVVEALRKKGLYDNSAVFLFSDHGDFTGDYGLVEKAQNTFEDCLTRVPFVFKPPRRYYLRPGVRDCLVELVDFSATVYDMAGIDPGYDGFGRSLVPLLSGHVAEHRDAVFCEGGRRYGEEQAMEKESMSYDNPEGLYWPRLGLQTTDDAPYHTKAAMCRTRKHKFVRRHYESDELYDLTNDPSELHNLVDDPACAEVLADMRERMLGWYMETCDVVPRETDRR
jgi:arylsulfatase A-like enzyme